MNAQKRLPFPPKFIPCDFQWIQDLENIGDGDDHCDIPEVTPSVRESMLEAAEYWTI